MQIAGLSPPRTYGATCFFLLFRPVRHDRPDGAHVCFDRYATHRCTTLCDLLDCDDGIQVGQSSAAVCLGNGHAHKARVCELPDTIPGILFCPVNFLGPGAKFGHSQLHRRCLQC